MTHCSCWASELWSPILICTPAPAQIQIKPVTWRLLSWVGSQPPLQDPEGPSTQYFRTLVPNTIQGMGYWDQRVLKYWVLGPSGRVSKRALKSGGPSEEGEGSCPPHENPWAPDSEVEERPRASRIRAQRAIILHTPEGPSPQR